MSYFSLEHLKRVIKIINQASKQINIRKLYIKTDDANLSPFRRQLKESNNAFLNKFYKEQGLL